MNHTPYKPRKSHLPPSFASFVPMQQTVRPRFSNEHEYYNSRLYQPMANNQTGVGFFGIIKNQKQSLTHFRSLMLN